LWHSLVFSSKCIDLSDLSIVSGESSWVIYADLVCLNHDGNLYDACLLALMESLKRCQIPETEVVEEGVGERSARQSEVCISLTNLRPLPIHHTIVPTTIGVMEQQLLADPTAAEEGQ
jgi:exosome complex component RRP43